MDVREKLIEILKTKYDHFCDQCGINKDSKYIENLASYLIDNGVTVQEWISVDDRLPDKNRKAVLIALRWEETDIGWYDKDDKCWQSEFVNSYNDGEVTHWMPLPNPPKGE